ncbi:MAG: triose-phosphate isomerase [Candidatus Pacebacteria bacterium]|jgi:triosephosphate isomerase|nr:triose-phosphate isomerase [Candidatus Paceibacterota bacterium]
MTKKVIIANWKMNPQSLTEAKKIVTAITTKVSHFKKVSVIIAPPVIYLESLAKLQNTTLAGQNLFWEESGAYTGEHSGTMLAKSGATYVIVGHSERRAMGETNEMVNKKVKAALKAGLKPILCIGESVRDEKGDYHTFIKEQIMQSLAGLKKVNLKNVIIAYEPVWAIGKNAKREATPAESLEMSIFIKKVLSDMFGAVATKTVALIYGGSVNTKNAEAFLSDGGVDGVLVGRESLTPLKFIQIVYSAEHLS